MPDVALFPIPNAVSFPGSTVPLHVFEPRYRTMIKYCVDNNTLLGICHTQKVRKQTKHSKSLEEALNSNQATYKPYPIFCAGKCEVIRVHEDGRLHINVHMNQRVKIAKEIQTLPFTICQCERFDDRAQTPKEEKDNDCLKEKIITRLLALTSHIERAQHVLRSEHWQHKTPSAFSFDLCSIIEFEADFAQALLEKTSSFERLQSLLNYLNQHP